MVHLQLVSQNAFLDIYLFIITRLLINKAQLLSRKKVLIYIYAINEQSLFLPLSVILTGSIIIYFLTFIEIQFTYYKIHFLKVFNSVGFKVYHKFVHVIKILKNSLYLNSCYLQFFWLLLGFLRFSIQLFVSFTDNNHVSFQQS